MLTSIKRQIIIESLKRPNEEICGFILYNSSYTQRLYLCNNISKNKHEEFCISDDEYLAASQEGIIVGIYHSHPGEKIIEFSEADKEYIFEHGIPLYIAIPEVYKEFADRLDDDSILLNLPLGEYIPSSYKDTLPKGLIGIPFIWGLNDCYSVVRNYFFVNFNVHLIDYQRDESFGGGKENDAKLLKRDSELILNNITENNSTIIWTAGTGQFPELKTGDVLLFHSNRILPIHFGIFKGNSRFLHHMQGCLSKIDMLDNHWMDRLTHIIRHNSQL